MKISKKLMTVLSLLIATLSFAQTDVIRNAKPTSGSVKIENLSIEVTVDSLEETESTFKTEDIRELLNEVTQNEAVSFKTTCNGAEMSNGKKSHISYTAKGNINNKEGFVESVEKMRIAAINYYKNKK